MCLSLLIVLNKADALPAAKVDEAVLCLSLLAGTVCRRVGCTPLFLSLSLPPVSLISAAM